MKRCPQCEFTFDDQQEFCDFDGAELKVLPELTPSLKNVSLPLPSYSFFGRVMRSRVTLAGISLAVVVLSALMVGYFDAANSPDLVSDANSERREKAQADRTPQGPSYASMERRVTSAKEASSMPSSSIDWLAEDSEEPESVASALNSTAAINTTSLRAKPRMYVRSNRQAVAANQRVFSRSPNKLANRPGRASVVTRRPKDSKVVAILKKTGSILAWPFKL